MNDWRESVKTYTKTGDKGQTSLYTGERVSKTNPRIHALGTIDELTSHLGKTKSIIEDIRMKKDIETIQRNLVDLMGIVASFGKTAVVFSPDKIKWVEDKIDLYSKEFVDTDQFIIPGKNEISAQVDITRTVARRAERDLLTCSNIPDGPKIYVNRLADFLYTIGRVVDANPAPLPQRNYVAKDQVITSQMENTISLEEAKALIHLIEQYAQYHNCNVSIAITNKDGNPICVQSMDGTLMIGFELAIKKAYTAAALQMPTHKLADLTAEGAPFFGLETILDKQIVTIGGGFPLIKNGQVYGAIGVSGGSADEDIDISTYGQYVWKGE